jgi:hypothetical protein
VLPGVFGGDGCACGFFLAENGLEVVKLQIQFWGFLLVYELKMGEGAASHSHFRASTIPVLKVSSCNDI